MVKHGIHPIPNIGTSLYVHSESCFHPRVPAYISPHRPQSPGTTPEGSRLPPSVSVAPPARPNFTMRLLNVISAAILAPAVGLAAPAQEGALMTRENLCSLKAPPALCTPNPATTVEETAKRAYQFYKAFVVDGNPKLMFSLIDSVYIVRSRPSSLSVSGRDRASALTSRSNTTPITKVDLRTSGTFSAVATRSVPKRGRHGASMPAPTCRMRATPTSTDGGGSTAVFTSTYVIT